MLEDFSDDTDEKPQANGLHLRLKKLETGILIVMWSQVMERFHMTSIYLQSPSQGLNTSYALHVSLHCYVQTKRSSFTQMEQKAENLTRCDSYHRETH